MLIWRGAILILGLGLLWQAIVSIFALPVYILPGPMLVEKAFVQNAALIMHQTWPTLIETLLGFLLGSLTGALTALAMMWFKPVKFWLLPLVVVSQAIPVFAIAPLLVVWFGYGIASKIVTTMLVLFFPVTSAFFDGLRNTPAEFLELAKINNASRSRELMFIRVPAALPSLASGLRLAAVFAPMGAIIGEWVGASRGLGFLMLMANARLEIALMFACLLVIVVMAMALYFLVDVGLRKLVTW